MPAQITIYKPADVVIAVIDGDPPVDQTALVASLQQQVASLSADKAALQGQVTSLTAQSTSLAGKIAAAQAALA